MKIWGRANSINVMKVLWAADECGIAYERTDVGGAFGGNDQPWYLKMNPNGVVPTIDDGGRVIWESNSAVRYLSAKYAAGTMWPNDPGQRSEADRWMDWQLSTISESMRVVFWGLVRTPPDKRDMAAIKKAAVDAGKLFGRLDAHLADRRYVAGQHFTMGDIPVGCFVHRWSRARHRAPRAQEPAGLVRPAGDAPGLCQAHHGQADLTPSGGAPSEANKLSTRRRNRVGPVSMLVGSMFRCGSRSISFCWPSISALSSPKAVSVTANRRSSLSVSMSLSRAPAA